MKLSQLAAFKKNESIVTQRHIEWMIANPNPVYTPKAKYFLNQQIGKADRERKGTFSASSLGSCPRAQQFTFMGMDQQQHTPELLAIFHNGTWMHLRWQLAGLSAGWLTSAEVPVRNNKFHLAGTKDGEIDGSHGLELKSCNTNKFARVLQYGVLKEHMFQVGSYMLADELDTYVVIYENKNDQEFKEIVVRRDEETIKKVTERADRIWQMTSEDKLFEMKDDCLAQKGYEYRGCPYREMCPEMHNLKDCGSK